MVFTGVVHLVDHNLIIYIDFDRKLDFCVVLLWICVESLRTILAWIKENFIQESSLFDIKQTLDKKPLLKTNIIILVVHTQKKMCWEYQNNYISFQKLFFDFDIIEL